MKKSVVTFLHAGYWVLYCSLLILICAAMNAGSNINPGQFKISWFAHLIFLFGFFPGMLGFYVFYFQLFPRFLSKRKIFLLIIWGLTATVAIVITSEILMCFTVKGAIWNVQNCFGIGTALSFNIIPNGILGLVMRGFIDWYGDIKVKEELNKKNYDMELALIKAQINPHFLFNTINNIDMLIQKDATKASDYLNKLSDMMRFMLYETKTEKITLAKELSYIEKYIELQRIRTSNLNYIKYSVSGSIDNLLIEPMLFIPFIENAFKHAENKKQDDAIKIMFLIENNRVVFECINAYSTEIQVKSEHGGLGNDLIQRRLSLLYPDHHIEISDKNGIYTLKLVLSLQP